MRRTIDHSRVGSRVGSPLRSAARRAALVLTSLLLAAGSQAAVVEGDRATFTWSPASGPVAGYNVYVTRNDVPPSAPDLAVTDPSALVIGSVSDTLLVQVAAFDSIGTEGPLSPASELVMLTAPPGPPVAVIEAAGDFSIEEALAAAQPGEQVVVHMRGSGALKQLLDAAPTDPTGDPNDWGLDQLVVGDPLEPTTVRLVDALGLDTQAPLANLPQLTLFGLGNGPACARDGESGLVIHPGSRLVLGGIDLFAFDGQSCVHINTLFPGSPDANVVAWDEGEVQLHGDLEDDGILDPDDNCLLIANEDQCDADWDGFGNLCDFDLDDNGVVDIDDVTIVMSAQQAVSQDQLIDSNCDGAVGLDDLSLVMHHMGQAPGPSGLPCAADASCNAN